MSSPCVDKNNTPCAAVVDLSSAFLALLNGCFMCELEQDLLPEEQAVIIVMQYALGIIGVSFIIAPFLLDYKALSPLLVAVVAGAFKFPSFLMNYRLLLGAGLASVGVGLYLGYNPGAPLPI